MNIGRLISTAAERHPTRPAFIWGDRIISYREAGARVSSLAAALRSLGLQPGDRVG